MGELKVSKDSRKVPNRALHSRISYLYQAATYLATQRQHSQTTKASSRNGRSDVQGCATAMAEAKRQASFESEESLQAASRRFIADLRDVSLKGQIRMSPAMKHSICKSCGTLLVDGSSCTSKVENKSKGGKKTWADILMRKCNVCGTARRYPVAAERQKRRPQRATRDSKESQEVAS